MKRYAGDPVAQALGKDVASIIYKCIHQTALTQLNLEYCSRLKKCKKNGQIVFFELNTDRKRFYFNWRKEISRWGDDICTWVVDGKCEISDVAKLSPNYWHSYAKK